MRSLLRTGLLLLPLLAAGCDHIEYHPYDTDISGEQNINAKNIARIEAACARQADRCVSRMISDTQRWYDETEKAVESASTPATTSTSCSTAGDLSDFGHEKRVRCGSATSSTACAYLTSCLLGNHDCQGTGEADVRRRFSDAVRLRIHGRRRALRLSEHQRHGVRLLDMPVPEFRFPRTRDRRLVRTAGAPTRSSWPCTCAPYDFQFNNNVAKVFEHYVMRFPAAASACIFGHEHRWIEEDLFGDGVMYYGCPNIEKRDLYPIYAHPRRIQL